MLKFCASFLASVVRFALSYSCRWGRYKVPACTAGIALAWLFFTAAAGAADVIWDGSTDVNWSVGANWTSNSAPSLTTDAVRFDNNSTANLNTVNDIVGLSIAGIVNTSAGANNGTSGPVSITGNPLTIGAAGLIMVSGNPQGPPPYTQPAQADLTVDVDLTLSAEQRWKAGGPGAATTAQPSGNQALIVGASPNGRTVTLNGFKPILTVISNANDQIIVNSKLVDGSTSSQVGISKATGTTTTFAYDTGNINAVGPRVRITGDNTYSGGTDIFGGRQLIQLASNSVVGVSGPLGTGPIAIHTESLVSGTINNQNPYFSPFGADRTLYNDINLNNVLTSTGSTPVQSYPTLYHSGSIDDTTVSRQLTLNGAISIPTNALLLQNSVVNTRTGAAGDLIVNGTVLLGGADFNSDGKVDAGDYVVWRKNPAARGGADGYRIWRENFGNTIPTPDGNPITTGTFTTGQTPSPTAAPGKSVYNGNILQANAATYTLAVTNGTAAFPTAVQFFGQNTYGGGTTLTSPDASSPTANANIGLGSSTVLSGSTIVSGPLGIGTLSVGSATVGTPSSIEALSAARTLANPINLVLLQSNLVVRGLNDLTLSGAITGFGGTTMNGAGKLTLGGTDNYSGTTAINSGTLLVDGALTTSGVTVASGATLGGSGGTITSNITNSGTIAPGASIGTLNVTGDVNNQAGSNWAIELSGTSSDLLAVTGNIDLSALDNLNVTGSGTGASWVIATYSGTLSGTFDSVTSGYSVTYGTGTNSQITLHTPGSGTVQSAVPEPGTIGLGLFAVGLATIFRRRNRGVR